MNRYDELAQAFAEYIAETNNGGDPVAPSDEAYERAERILTDHNIPRYANSLIG